MTTSTPLVSVVVPVWNGSAFLAEALGSIAAQDLRDFETVVVDDASDDDSTAIATRFAVKLLRHDSQQGVAAARNHAIRESVGRILAFLDQDDVWEPSMLRAQVGQLGRSPDCISCASGVFFVEPGHTVPDWFQRRKLLDGIHPHLVPSGLAFGRETFARVGWFDEGYRHASDLDWLARARQAGIAIEILPDLLLRRRLHGGNDSRHEAAKEEMYRAVQSAHLRRRGEKQR